MRLRYEVSGRGWSEETITQDVSLHGACMECSIPIGKGETMSIERMDIGRRAQAKVRWQKRRVDGSQLVGVEVIDCADFWGVKQV